MNHLQQDVKLFCQQNGLDCSLESRLLDLLSELGEVAKEILLATKYGKQTATLSQGFGEEIGDLQFSLLALANQAGIKLEDVTRNAMAKYALRVASKGHAGS